MKKTLCFVVACAALLCGCLSSVRVEEKSTKYSAIDTGSYASVTPVGFRDFESKGLIFVKSKVVVDMITGEKTGSEITNEMLLKEAAKVGADDVINVRIDVQTNYSLLESYDNRLFENTDPSFDGNSISNFGTLHTPSKVYLDKLETYTGKKYAAKEYIYSASALAIKYTKAVIMPVSVETKTTVNRDEEEETETKIKINKPKKSIKEMLIGRK